MKVTTDPLGYCKKIPAGIRAILLYGPNRALVAEAVEEAKKSFLGATESNDFSVVAFTPESFKNNPTALADEFSSFGFFAAKKFIYIKDADDALAKSLPDILALPDAGHFIVLEADELTPRSALRLLAEKANDIAALACYMLEGANLQRFVQAQFTAQNAKISNDATMMLIDRLGADLSPLKNLVAQLISYAGTTIQIEHVEAMLVDQAEQETDALVQAVCDANMPQLDRAIHTLEASGIAMVAILRSLQYYFYRLRSMQVAIKNGEDVDMLMKRLKIFFKLQPAMKRQLRSWNLQRIDGALNEFTRLEAACKKTGTPELLLVHHRLMRLALSGRK